MNSHIHAIFFKLINGKEEITVQTHEGEYRNLMVLINEKVYVEDFGECKGIGRCGTCLVEIDSPQDAPEMDRNEKSTLGKCDVQNENLRLACQIMIDNYLQNAIVKIVEDREDVR
ncbi:MAG: 2Fe-2S iron-sulfur cluster-binding protein [Ginsengibacter sp.]|jgi:2Fe-2S ferredoxin